MRWSSTSGEPGNGKNCQGMVRFLMEQMHTITSAKATALFTDIDTQIGERVFVFTLDRDLEAGFSKA